MTTSTRITVNEIPLTANLEAKNFKYLHSNMGDFYIVFCRDMNTGNEYNVMVTDGYLFTYLETIRQDSNPFRFSIKRLLDVDSGQYIVSVNGEHNWIALC